MNQADVKSVDVLAPDIFELTLERGDFTFEPGDCVAVFKTEDVSRPYSISSGVNEDHLRFLVRRIAGGTVSDWLAQRQPGDTVTLSAPFGWFRPAHGDEPDSPRVFVATGTGIAPFLSALKSTNTTPVLCLYGVRTRADAVAFDYLAQRCPVKLAVSREVADPHHHGRVTDLLEEIPLETGTHFYLCGLDAMIDQTSTWLEAHAIDITHIHREVFFNA